MTVFTVQKKWIPWIVVLLILLLDQISKIVIKTNMHLYEHITVLGDWFHIYFIENEGMAFGMQFRGEYGKLILSLFRIVAVTFIGWYLHKLIRQGAPTGLIVCVSMIMAGALGNIIDSAFYGLIFSESLPYQTAQIFPEDGGYGTFLHGKVVDMLYFPVIQGYYPEWSPVKPGQEFIFFRPVFNLADSSITVGVFILLIFQKKFFEFEKKAVSTDKGSVSEIKSEK